MRKQSIYKLLAIAGILIVVFPASTVFASSIKLVPTSTTTGLMVGDLVSFDVTLDFSDVIILPDPNFGGGGIGTIGGGLDISWDSALLGLNSVSQNPGFGNPLDPIFATLVSPPTDLGGGVLFDWSFVDFVGVESGILGSIEFSVLANITIDTDILLSPGATPWVDLDFPGSILNPQYTGATVGIVSVPTPATLSLFAIGLVGLLGFTRRRKIN